MNNQILNYDKNEYPLTQAQKKLKNNWFALTIFRQSWFFMVIGFVYLTTPHAEQNKMEFYSSFISSLIISIIIISILYVCAYKKPGTRLLTIALISTAMQFAKSFDLTLFYLDWWVILIYLLDIILLLWWYILTFKVRKLNSKIARGTPIDGIQF
jgi:hypothetical protein